MIPLYGFLKGDTIGLLVLAYNEDTVETIAKKLQKAAAVRVPERPDARVIYNSQVLEPHLTVAQVGFAPLDRIDVE